MWNEEHIKRLLMDVKDGKIVRESRELYQEPGLLSLASSCKHAEIISCVVTKFIWGGSVFKWLDIEKKN